LAGNFRVWEGRRLPASDPICTAELFNMIVYTVNDDVKTLKVGFYSEN
jgi:hypothetical protein